VESSALAGWHEGAIWHRLAPRPAGDRIAQLPREPLKHRGLQQEPAHLLVLLTRRMPKKKALVATGNSMLTIMHALLADPDACYQDLGADYYEQRMHTRRQARNHIKSLERLGYQVTIQALNPDTSQPLTATA
jgi:hypothetical protein